MLIPAIITEFRCLTRRSSLKPARMRCCRGGRLKSLLLPMVMLGKFAWLFVLASCLVLGTEAKAQAQMRLSVGGRFHRQLSSPASIYWSQAPMHSSFRDLAATRRIAIFIDRRCDPNRKLSFRSSQDRFQDCLWQFAASSDLDVAWFDNVVYVAPDNVADRLATVHQLHREQMSQLGADQRRRWRSTADFSWPRLTNPLDLLERLEKELGQSIEGKSRIHHDLWPEQSLPRMPLYQRLELLLVGFDSTFKFLPSGGAKIVRLPASPRYESSLRVDDADKANEIRELLKQYANAQWDGKNLKASWQVRRAIDRVLNPPRPRRNSNSVRYTLRAENQVLGNFVRGLCDQLELECQFVDVSAELLESRISFEVKRATQLELFDAILRPVGLESSTEPGETKSKLVVRMSKTGD